MNRTMHSLLVGVLVAWLALVVAPVHAADGGSRILSPEQLAHSDGRAIYEHVCQACHMPDARGATGAGQFPSLAGDPRLASSRFMISVLLMGRSNMPSFRPRPGLRGFEAAVHITLTDPEIARVVNYVRSHFGNHYTDRVTAADVAAMHPAKQVKP